jgi:hypothetical protein
MDYNGDFVVTWYGYDANGYGILAQRYNSDGSKPLVNGDEFHVNTYTSGDQYSSSVAMDDNGDFVITWKSRNQDGESYGIYAQRYDSAGFQAGSEFQVNTFTTNTQINPKAAMDSDGDFIITWMSYSQDGYGYGVFAQRYNSDGSKPLVNGSEFQVNSVLLPPGDQSYPSVAMDNSGNFIIAWQGYGSTPDELNGVYAQRYDSSGNILSNGSEFHVNTYTNDNQYHPTVAVDNAGEFVISWDSYLQDGSAHEVYAQYFGPTGSPLGSEFRVNTYITGNQFQSAVGMDNTGDFVITWNGYGQDSDYSEIFFKRYNNPGASE